MTKQRRNRQVAKPASVKVNEKDFKDNIPQLLGEKGVDINAINESIGSLAEQPQGEKIEIPKDTDLVDWSSIITEKMTILMAQNLIENLEIKFPSLKKEEPKQMSGNVIQVDKRLFYKLMMTSVKGTPFRGNTAVAKFAEVVGITESDKQVKFWQEEVQEYLANE